MYSLSPIAAYYNVVHVHVKYRKSIEIVSKSTRYRYRIFRRYRYFKNDPIPDTSSTRYRFRPISNNHLYSDHIPLQLTLRLDIFHDKQIELPFEVRQSWCKATNHD